MIFVQVLKMEEDKRRAAELRFQADKQAKEAALAAQDHPAAAAKVCVLLSLRRLVKHD